MRQIDAEILMDKIARAKKARKIYGVDCACSFLNDANELCTEWRIVEDLVENAATVDRLKARRGQWLKLGDGVRCSVCNYKLLTTGLTMFCPNCGAEMER